MNGIHLPAVRLRRLKWLIIFITILTITAGEIIHAYQQNNFLTHFITWIAGIAAAVVIIEIAFRRITAIQGQLEDVSQESQELVRQQTSLLRLSDKLAAITNPEDICKIISQELQETLGSELRVLCQFIDLDGGIIEYAAAQPREVMDLPGISKEGLPVERRTVNIPMQVGEVYVGELIVEAENGNKLTEENLSIINGVANQAALAIENAKLIAEHKNYQRDAERREAELRVRERYLSLLNEITRTTLKTQDFQAMLQSLVEYLGKLLEADNVLIILWEPVRKLMIPAAAYGPLRQIYRSIHFDSGDLPLVPSVLNAGRNFSK